MANFNFEQYGDIHRAFLQAIMAKGILGGKDVSETFTGVLKTFGVRHDVADRADLKRQIGKFVLTINRELRSLAMEIRRYVDERSGVPYYVLVSRMASEQTVNAFKDYTPNEIQYFKTIVSAMFDNDDRSINNTTALNLTRDLPKKLSMEDAETLLDRWLGAKWLEKERRGNLHLHVKAISDLEPYLKQKFQLSECYFCKSLITLSKNSKCSSCDVEAHPCCIKKSRERQPYQCPGCRAVWALDDYTQMDSSSSQSSQSPQRTPASSATSYRRVQPVSDDSDSGSPQRTSATPAVSLRRVQPIADDSDSEE